MWFSDVKKWWTIPRSSGLMLVVFVAVFFYQGHILNYEGLNQNRLEQEDENAISEKPTLTTLTPEKVYEHLIQAKDGDVFRLGFVAQSHTEQTVDVILQSTLGERMIVGSITLIPSKDMLYHEVVFSVPSRSDDVILRLHDAKASTVQTQWLQSQVYVASIFATRLDIESTALARRLHPTRFGLASSGNETLSEVSHTTSGKTGVSWSFEARGDAISALGIPENFSQIEGYFSLYKERSLSPDTILVRATFDTSARLRTRLPTGGYRLPLLYPLQKGERYRLVFETVAPDVSLSTLLLKAYENSPAVVYWVFMAQNEGFILNSARLEDVGNELIYSFGIQNKPDDFLNLYSLGQKVRFDLKKKRVVGARKKDEYFTYRFDTLYPFERFALEAQSGSTKNDVMLEYSYDNASWLPVLTIRDAGQPNRFRLSLSGSRETRVVFVRIRYIGDEKKTGSFSLEQLNVHARISKSKHL